MTEITAEWCREQGACYDDLRLAKLFDHPHTLREVMTRTDGSWSHVPPRHRLWVACHALPAREARLLACQWAERALLREREAGREPHAYLWAAIEVSRRYADGKATDEELEAARAAQNAPWKVGKAASWAASWAAWDAVSAAAWEAAWVLRTAWEEEVRTQVADVMAVLDGMGL